MIRNSIRSAYNIGDAHHSLFTKRPEQLSLEEFIELTNWVEDIIKN
jgi:16S rRNA (adenine1518-N6/adenine1519-N6)-dimethyltransferase